MRHSLIAVAFIGAACGTTTASFALGTPTATPSMTPSASLVSSVPSATVAPPSSTAPASVVSASPTPAVTTSVPATASSIPPAPSLTPSATPVVNPGQTRVPNSSAIPTPQGLPATDGCISYGQQPGYINFVDCVVHGLPVGAPVTLTVNGVAVFLRIGATVVYPDGTWYFAWSESQHAVDTFVVTAGGVSRTITQIFY